MSVMCHPLNRQRMAHFLHGGVGVAQNRKRNPVAAILFLGYAALMIYLLFIRNRTVTDGLPYWEQIRANCSFVPWRTAGNYWDVLTRPEHYIHKWGSAAVYNRQATIAVVNILGNVVMFVPFGMFLPAMWSRLRRAWKSVPVGVLMILLVEVLQLFTLRGRCDVDDVILNAIGILTGYALWRLTHRKKKK